MLNESLTYGVRRIDPTAREWTSSPLDEALRGASEIDPVSVYGAWLVQAGLALPRMLAESAAICRIVAESAAGVLGD